MKIKNLLIVGLLFIVFSCVKSVDNQVANDKQNVTIKTVEKKPYEELETWDSITEDSDLMEYFKFLNPKYLNKKQKIRNRNGKAEITYLGPILTQNGDTASHVISLYLEVQAAIQIHGHSNIIFIQKDRKLVRRFDLSGQEELPYKLENNILYFQYKDSSENSQDFVDTVGIKLPKLVCVSPENCY